MSIKYINNYVIYSLLFHEQLYLPYSLTYVCIEICIDWNMCLLQSIIGICIYSVFINNW